MNPAKRRPAPAPVTEPLDITPTAHEQEFDALCAALAALLLALPPAAWDEPADDLGRIRRRHGS